MPLKTILLPNVAKHTRRQEHIHMRKILKYMVLYSGFFLMAILAIPIGLFLIPIAVVWTLTDKALKRLED